MAEYIVTLTFNEAVTGLTAGDLTIPNCTITTAIATSDGGLTYTCGITPDAGILDSSNVISLDMTGVVDAALNPGVGITSSPNYEVNTATPTAIISALPSHANTGVYNLITVTFDQPVVSFTGTPTNCTAQTFSSLDGNLSFPVHITDVADGPASYVVSGAVSQVNSLVQTGTVTRAWVVYPSGSVEPSVISITLSNYLLA